jgi:hypothetical protein
MESMLHHPRRRSSQRRTQALAKARAVIRTIADGSLDPYEGYRQVYGIYLDTSGAAEELNPLFRLPGIVPDGSVRVDDEFRRTVISAAAHWLEQNCE